MTSFKPPLANGVYHVEVSGWDLRQEFFLEKCDLEWSEESGKRVALTSGLRDGAMIFVRLLQPLNSDPPLPVAYKARLMGRGAGRQQVFRLERLTVARDEGANARR